MVSKGATLGMNRNERLFVGLENVAGSLNIVFAIRFEGTVSKEAARAAVREIVRAHPRLRSLVEPTTFGHRFRILPAGPAVDERVDAAFEVFRGIDIDDDAAIADASARFANEPIVIEEELPIRVRFLPHRERPVLLLSVH
ncbi:MAG: hypothetical protein H5U40_14690, partial [Polyangiaceae bacterium]|nr:hypothetical protein [Polyangiaceae bacterium]